MERYLVGTKIARQRDGRMERYLVDTKNSSPKGWTDGEIHG